MWHLISCPIWCGLSVCVCVCVRACICVFIHIFHWLYTNVHGTCSLLFACECVHVSGAFTYMRVFVCVCFCACVCVFDDDWAICACSTFANAATGAAPAASVLQLLPSHIHCAETRQEAPPSWTGFLLNSPSHCAPVILLDDGIEMIGEENRFDETFN